MAWNCPVCGFSEKGARAPASCPVCGTAGERFTSSEISQSRAAPAAQKTPDKPQQGQEARRWKCPVCGYTRSGEKSDEPCPVCGTSAERFFSPDEPAAAEEAGTEAPPGQPAPEGEQERQWRCTVCGYIHTGPEPPEKCPVCGSPRSVFVEITPQAEPQPAEKPAEAAVTAASAESGQPPPASMWMQRVDLLREKMVELHAHPISVHIPNGLLPIAVLFLLLSMIFGSPALSRASFYNLIVVALAMPAVLFSGYNDWQKRFNGQMTPVFLIKMICGTTILIGSFVLVIWRLLSPDVAAAGSGGRWGYLVVHLVLLAAAGMAGYQGGKLVIFPGASGTR